MNGRSPSTFTIPMASRWRCCCLTRDIGTEDDVTMQVRFERSIEAMRGRWDRLPWSGQLQHHDAVGGIVWGGNLTWWLAPSTHIAGPQPGTARGCCSPTSRQAGSCAMTPTPGRVLFREHTNHTNGLAFDSEGRLYGCCSGDGPLCVSSPMARPRPSWTSSTVSHSTPQTTSPLTGRAASGSAIPGTPATSIPARRDPWP